jgi:hypothetical protein
MLASLGLLAAGGFSILLAVADFRFRSGTPADVERAVQLLPRDATYLSFQALQVAYEGGDARPLLERIVKLEPFSSAPRIRLGLDAEVRGDQADAERWLLEAASIDRQYEPRWTLANYYFRQQRAGDFWKWMRAALEVSYGDRRPAFDLCWQVSNDAAAIWTRAIPESRETIAAYLAYVLRERHPEAVPQVSMKLAMWKAPQDLPLLEGALDALLDAGDVSHARDLWEALGYASPNGIVGADFDTPQLGHGFDWRFNLVPGVTHLVLDAPPAHRIMMNGQQPESCELLRQFVLLKAGHHYILHWESRTDSIPAMTGVSWNLSAAHAMLPASKDWTVGEMPVVTQTIPSAVLSLTYQRPSGQVRAEGRIDLRHVTLTESAE